MVQLDGDGSQSKSMIRRVRTREGVRGKRGKVGQAQKLHQEARMNEMTDAKLVVERCPKERRKPRAEEEI